MPTIPGAGTDVQPLLKYLAPRVVKPDISNLEPFRYNVMIVSSGISASVGMEVLQNTPPTSLGGVLKFKAHQNETSETVLLGGDEVIFYEGYQFGFVSVGEIEMILWYSA